MHAVYVVASLVLFALVWPLLAAHPKLRQGFRRRLGAYPPDFLAGKKGPRIWLHGASAGDLLALLPIHRELKRLRPDATIIVSTMTNSGATIAEARFKDADAITFVPYDVFFAVNRAVEAIKPDVLVLEYTELWPNLVRAVKRRGGRVVITNGRLSERNVSNYRLLFTLIGNLLRDIDLLLMREDAERERALSLGAPKDRVRVTGNTKFDALLSTKPGPVEELSRAFCLRPDDLLLVAGSTHEGEEAVLLEVFANLRRTFPTLRLVIAPRYLERVTRVVTLAADRGLEVSLRSASNPQPTPVVVLDTIGELAGAYRLATLVFVGGSFTSRGGQNILEPAACAKPVLFGPHMENFHDSVQLLVGRGGIQVNDGRHLESVAAELLARPEKIAEVGALAQETVSSVSGASTRNAKLIAGLVPRNRHA